MTPLIKCVHCPCPESRHHLLTCLLLLLADLSVHSVSLRKGINQIPSIWFNFLKDHDSLFFSFQQPLQCIFFRWRLGIIIPLHHGFLLHCTYISPSFVFLLTNHIRRVEIMFCVQYIQWTMVISILYQIVRNILDSSQDVYQYLHNYSTRPKRHIFLDFVTKQFSNFTTYISPPVLWYFKLKALKPFPQRFIC